MCELDRLAIERRRLPARTVAVIDLGRPLIGARIGKGDIERERISLVDDRIFDGADNRGRVEDRDGDRLGVAGAAGVGDRDRDRVGIARRTGRVLIEILVGAGEAALALGQVERVAPAVAPVDRNRVDVDGARVVESAIEGRRTAFVDGGRIGVQIGDRGDGLADVDRVGGVGIADVAGGVADRAEHEVVADRGAGQVAGAGLRLWRRAGLRQGLARRAVDQDGVVVVGVAVRIEVEVGGGGAVVVLVAEIDVERVARDEVPLGGGDPQIEDVGPDGIGPVDGHAAPLASQSGCHARRGPRSRSDPAIIIPRFAARAGHLLGRVVPGGQLGRGQLDLAIVDVAGRVDRAVVPEMDVGVRARVAEVVIPVEEFFVEQKLVGPGDGLAVEVGHVRVGSPVTVGEDHVLGDGEAVVSPIVGADGKVDRVGVEVGDLVDPDSRLAKIFRQGADQGGAAAVPDQVDRRGEQIGAERGQAGKKIVGNRLGDGLRGRFPRRGDGRPVEADDCFATQRLCQVVGGRGVFRSGRERAVEVPARDLHGAIHLLNGHFELGDALRLALVGLANPYGDLLRHSGDPGRQLGFISGRLGPVRDERHAAEQPAILKRFAEQAAALRPAIAERGRRVGMEDRAADAFEDESAHDATPFGG